MPRKARPTTPSMMLGPLGGPNSPPQTPTSTTPMINRKFTVRQQPPWHNLSRPTLLEDSGIQPTGNGHEFSFTPSNRFAQLSPRTSSEDSESNEDEEDTESESESEEDKAMQAVIRDDEEREEDSDDDEEDSDDDDGEKSEDEDEDVPMNFLSLPSAPMPGPMPVPMFVPGTAVMPVDGSSEEESDDEEEAEEDDDSDSASESESESVVTPPTQETLQESHHNTAATATAPKANFTLEELSDFDPMDQDRTGTIAPSGFSSPASARSRSRAPAPKELPLGLTRKMGDLNCGLSSSEASDEDLDEDEAAHREFVRRQRELRMRKRRSHGSSIGKRTISERSDSDHEDWTPLDPDAVGSSARRLRRRVGDRRSFIHLQFQDPPPARIDELEEPESEVEGTFFCDSGTLAQELPYYSIEIMEYSTPSP